MLKQILIGAAALLASLLPGCTTVRTTASPRTALEQALISEAAVRVIGAFKIPDQGGRTYSLDPALFKPLDAEFAIGEINHALLKTGLRAGKTQAESDLIVFPRGAYAGTDDSTFLIGIPSLIIPIPFTATGGFPTPEVALYKSDKRYGRARMAMYAIERETGKLAFEAPLEAAQCKYKLYTLLLFIHFRTTDLPAPH